MVLSGVCLPRIFYACCGLAGMAMPAAAGAADAAADVRIEGIQAQLFLTQKGDFSTDVLQPHDLLFNRELGGAPFDAVLVKVQLSGNPGTVFDPSLGGKVRHINVVAEEVPYPGALVLEEKAAPFRFSRVVPALGPDGKAYAAFWFTPGGCTPLRVTAFIPQLPDLKPVESRIEFACAE